MNADEIQLAIWCDDVVVRFPLLPPRQAWRLIFQSNLVRWHEALKGVTVHVPHGQIVGVIGKNGAGKSTLLRMLAGVYPTSSGHLVRLGDVSALFELGGMGGALITGEQYIKRWFRLNGVSRKNWSKLVDDIRDFSELGDRLSDRILTYSSGMAARLYFATATCVGNEIYLIDELLSVGDEHFQAKCWKRVRSRLKDGVSGVLATHDWAAIMRLCKNTYELESGRIVASGDSERIICDYLKLAKNFDVNRAARIMDNCPMEVVAESCNYWHFDVPVKVFDESEIGFSYSIEKLVIGQEWQVLILGEEVLIGDAPGEYLVKIEILDLPLPAGDYRLNLFLTGRKGGGSDHRITYDTRSWTTGNSIKLVVSGQYNQGLIIMPVQVKC